MSLKTKNIVIVVSCILLAAFSLPALTMKIMPKIPWFDKLTPQEEVAYAKQYVDLIRARDFVASEKQTDSKILNDNSRKIFGEIADLFSNDVPKSIKPIKIDIVRGNNVTQTSLLFEYELPNKWLTVNIILVKQNNNLFVHGAHINLLPDSLENLTRFTFEGKTLTHYIVFAVAIALLIFSIYVLILCIKTPIPKRKWLWIIFVLIGFCAITFNWTTGHFFFQPFILRIPLAYFSQDPYQPLLITMAVPVGAMVFFYKRKKWLAPS